jgi:hypothetical protein
MPNGARPDTFGVHERLDGLDLRSPGVTKPKSEPKNVFDDFYTYISVSVEIAPNLSPGAVFLYES